jgi:pimeloyl-ACP methyl ester carboxylesterase
MHLGCCTRLLYGLSAWELDCHASVTKAPQVSRHYRLSVSDRHVPNLTLQSGTQPARQRSRHVGGEHQIRRNLHALLGPAHHVTRVLAGAGHYLQSDAPADYAAAIAGWWPRGGGIQ